MTEGAAVLVRIVSAIMFHSPSLAAPPCAVDCDHEAAPRVVEHSLALRSTSAKAPSIQPIPLRDEMGSSSAAPLDARRGSSLPFVEAFTLDRARRSRGATRVRD